MSLDDPVTREEIEEIKQAFKTADKYGDGWIGRAELGQVFKELDSWSNEDLDDIFKIVDKSGDGRISYIDFIDWIMNDGDPLGEEPKAEEAEAEEADSSGDEGGMEEEADVEGVDIDLDECFIEEHWVRIMKRLDEDELEAKEMYEEVVSEARRDGENVDSGVPLRNFLDELQIEIEDRESLKHLAKVIENMKAAVRAGGVDADGSGSKVLKPALNKIVRLLDKAGKRAEDAWELIIARKVGFTKAGRKAIMAYEDRQGELISLIKEARINPPLLNSSSGQTSAKESCIEDVNEIIARCKAAGTKFTDPEFDLLSKPNECLYVDKSKPGYDCTVARPAGYKRLTELFKAKPKSSGGGMSMFSMLPSSGGGPVLFKGGIKAGDINQGQIGTCFLLGAMGAMVSNNDQAIKKMFYAYDIETGVYGIRLNVDGEWTYTIIDDVMPIDEYGNILYAHCKDKEEVWCPLLEKAYCKMHTCFEMCDGGFANEAICAFFGGCGGKLTIGKPQHDDPQKYFQVLKHAREKGWLLTTAFQATKVVKGQGKCGESMLPGGLVGGHVYSILKLVKFKGQHLIQCRNPWGTGEWQGKWSDNNAQGEWTDEMKEATGYRGINDGKFWMSVEDFVTTSCGAEFVRTFGPNWKKVTQYGQFQRGKMDATALWAYSAAADDELGFQKGSTIEVLNMDPGWWFGQRKGTTKKGFFPGNYVDLDDRPVARFDLQGTPSADCDGNMTVVVVLIQQNACEKRKFFKRKQDGMNYKDTSYPLIKLTVVGPDGKVAAKRERKKRVISRELKLPGGGLWKIYAQSAGGMGSQFAIRCFVKDGTASLTEVPGSDAQEITDAIARG